MYRMLTAIATLGLLIIPIPCFSQSPVELEPRIRALEARLRVATEALQTVTAEIAALKKEATRSSAAARTDQTQSTAEAVDTSQRSFVAQVLGITPESSETGRLDTKPEIFLQSRFSAFPLPEATLQDYQPNFRVSRATMRWAGKVNAQWSAGVELQYRAAPDNVPEQVLSEAYLSYDAKPALSIRAGQFVKPFGFDVQEPDALRLSPERAMFAGYVFPGERDRGFMLHGRLDAIGKAFQGVEYSAAIVNGNRFFKDSNPQVNYLFRLRKTAKSFALGGSAQLGTQITPPNVEQTDDENVYGADVQWAAGRFGLRAEFVHANRPSTLLAPEPVFAPAFVAGNRVRTVGSTVTGLWSFTPDCQAYLRLDRLAGDTIQLCPDQKDGSCKIQAVNGGIRQRVAQYGYIGIDLQWKSRISFNHDAVNTRLQVTSSLVF